MAVARRLIATMQSSLHWRLPLYRSLLLYLLTLRNGREVVDYVRKRPFGRPFSSIRTRAGAVIHVANPNLALDMYKDTWLNRAYTRHYAGPAPNVVVDIGANIGVFALFAKTQWPSCRVYCYEPMPANFALLQQNIHDNHAQDVFPQQAAVAERAGERKLFVDASSVSQTLP